MVRSMANKNIKMLKCFFSVMRGNEKAVHSILPDMYEEDIYQIDYDFLKKNNLTNIIFDIDNTIMPVDEINVENKLLELINKLKEQGFNICIMSNGSEKRVLHNDYRGI